MFALGSENHAAHAWVQRQLGQLQTGFSNLATCIYRAQLLQQQVAIGNQPGTWRFNEREFSYITQTQSRHAQNYRSQRAAQDFRLGKFRASVKILF